MSDLLTRPTAPTVVDATHPDRIGSGRPDGPPAGPIWFYRTNPFRRARLADRSLVSLTRELVRADAAVAERTDAALDELHGLIGSTEDDGERKRLLALSRALRRGKRLPDGEHTPALAAWEASSSARDRVVEDITSAYADVLRRERRELCRQLGDPSLRSSLALVAPEVARQAERYVDHVAASGEGSSRLLKSERGLLQYVLRAAVRTSPLAQLTAVGLTHARPGGADPDRPRITAAQSFCAVDRVMLDYLVSGTLDQTSLGHDPRARIGLPPTSALDGDRFWFLVPHEGSYRRASIPVSPPWADVLASLAMGPVPVDHLVAEVSRRTSAPATVVEQLVRTARDKGMLVLLRPSTDADLAEFDPPAGADDGGRLTEVGEGLAQLAEAEPAQRPALVETIESHLATLSRDAERPARAAITEDRLLALEPVDPTRWGPALDDLGPAVELLHTFDWLADVAIALKDSFVAEHGAGARVPLLDHAPRLVEQVTRAAESMTTAYLEGGPTAIAALGGADSPLAHLYAVRRRVEDHIGSAFDAALAKNAAEVVLTHEDVETLLAAMPAALRERPLSYGVLVQSTGDGLVVNDGLPGHGMLFSRFLGMDRAAGGTAVAALRARLEHVYGAAGTRVVEDRSTHGLNVNVHPPVLDHGLEPEDWARLELEHDAEHDALHVVDGDERLTVLPLGGGHPGLYPPALSVASGLVIAGRLYNGLPDLYAERDDRGPDTTRRVPRMRVGSVVISRARWYPGEDLARILALPNESERFVELTRWRAEHGVPDEVVVKTVPADTGPASVGSPDAQAVRFRSKPQYVDLTSALCVRVLPRMLDRRGGEDAPPLYLEEASPDLGSAPHASEWVVEVDRPRGGRFGYGENR